LKICPLGWNRSSKTPQRIVAEREELKFSELVKQSRRKRRKLVLVEIEELKIDELVKQSSRKR